MSDPFFEHPILNFPYEKPLRHWELDSQGQPTQRIIESRRVADFITPIPKPRMQRAGSQTQEIVFEDDHALSTTEQHYDASWINKIRHHVDLWRSCLTPNGAAQQIVC